MVSVKQRPLLPCHQLTHGQAGLPQGQISHNRLPRASPLTTSVSSPSWSTISPAPTWGWMLKISQGFFIYWGRCSWAEVVLECLICRPEKQRYNQIFWLASNQLFEYPPRNSSTRHHKEDSGPQTLIEAPEASHPVYCCCCTSKTYHALNIELFEHIHLGRENLTVSNTASAPLGCWAVSCRHQGARQLWQQLHQQLHQPRHDGTGYSFSPGSTTTWLPRTWQSEQPEVRYNNAFTLSHLLLFLSLISFSCSSFLLLILLFLFCSQSKFFNLYLKCTVHFNNTLTLISSSFTKTTYTEHFSLSLSFQLLFTFTNITVLATSNSQ